MQEGHFDTSILHLRANSCQHTQVNQSITENLMYKNLIEIAIKLKRVVFVRYMLNNMKMQMEYCRHMLPSIIKARDMPCFRELYSSHFSGAWSLEQANEVALLRSKEMWVEGLTEFF